MRVGLFVTCFGDTLFPSAGQAVVRLLERLGARGRVPEEQTCCGQMHLNSGYADEGLALARRLAAVFEGYEAVVTPSASCAGMVREQLGAEAPPVYELSEFLVDVLGVDDVGAYYPHRVTYHPTCHSLRALRVGDRSGCCSRRCAASTSSSCRRARVLRLRRDVRGEERGRLDGDALRQGAGRARHARRGGVRGRLLVPDAHRRRPVARAHRRAAVHLAEVLASTEDDPWP